ncbi:MAG: helix-turn-helix domain-containing protein [Oscillospiraceae bacterium]|nr:helix-turn-helix domain-containing protein [Oscillospiraceae bacterium]
MTLGENIRRKRLEYDIEQQELAQRVGIKNAMLCLIEHNKRKPSLDTLKKLADALHCSVDELLGRKAS